MLWGVLIHPTLSPTLASFGWWDDGLRIPHRVARLFEFCPVLQGGLIPTGYLDYFLVVRRSSALWLPIVFLVRRFLHSKGRMQVSHVGILLIQRKRCFCYRLSLDGMIFKEHTNLIEVFQQVYFSTNPRLDAPGCSYINLKTWFE